MWETADFTRRRNWLHHMPVPVTSIYSTYDIWEPTGPGAQTWYYEIPPDGMVYSICSYTHMANQITWLGSQIKINDEVVWFQIGGEGQSWLPGYQAAVRMVEGDLLEVTLTHVMDVLYKYYWQLDFWREPASP